jgi:hypothetical protein
LSHARIEKIKGLIGASKQRCEIRRRIMSEPRKFK